MRLSTQHLRAKLSCIGPLRFAFHLLLKWMGRTSYARVTAFGQHVRLRLGSPDVDVFWEVTAGGAYSVPLSGSPKVIIDAGAHIGLAALYFRWRWPNVRLICIEPCMLNAELLMENIRPVDDHVVVLARALWSCDTTLPLRDRKTGNWGFSLVSGVVHKDTHIVRTVTLQEIIANYCNNYVDLFKCDIEGAEREVFARSAEWIDRVSVIAIELHDRFEPGCRESVLSACADFPERLWLGRTLVLGRKGTLRITETRC